MDKTKVQFNLHKSLGKLQEKNNRSYNASDIEAIVHNVFPNRISRQTIHRFMKPANVSVRAVTDDTLATFLDFFAMEGMPITINDLFTVTTEPKENIPTWFYLQLIVNRCVIVICPTAETLFVWLETS